MIAARESLAVGGVRERRGSSGVAVRDFCPAFANCALEMIITLLFSPGNTIPFRRHWMSSGGGNVVEKTKDAVEPAATAWLVGEMEAPGSITGRNCFTPTSLSSSSSPDGHSI